MIVDLILLFLLLLLLWRLLSKPDRYPPGPFKWPVVGNVFQLKKWGPYLYQSMTEIQRRYGDVAGFFIGPKPIVLVSGVDAIKEISFRDDFSGRPLMISQRIDKERIGLLFTDGEKWKEQRRFTLRHLRDFGFGKTSMENITIEETESVLAGLDAICAEKPSEWSKPIVVHDILGTAIINVLWHIMAGKRYSFSDPYLNKLLAYVKTIIANSETGDTIQLAYPELAVRFPFLSTLYEVRELRKPLLSFIKDEVKNHEIAVDPDNPKDFIDSYLIEIEKQKDNQGFGFSEKQLVRIAYDLFAAGYDTTFNTLTFGLLYMVLYPEVQRKVQEEIDNVIGRDRLPSFSDRERLPYCEATILEILRFSSVVPVSVPHAPLTATKDIEFRGYIIPKDAQIFLNLYGLHHDPKIWGDANNFRPDRFLGENGSVLRHEALLPFGTGKRACIGESLARNNVYLFFVCLMQKYSMRVPEGEEKPSAKPQGGITIVSKPFKVQVRKRT